MLQFVACMSTALYGIYYNLYPFYLSLLNIWVMVNMLVLFGNFYTKRYATPATHTQAAQAKQHVEGNMCKTDLVHEAQLRSRPDLVAVDGIA